MLEFEMAELIVPSVCRKNDRARCPVDWLIWGAGATGLRQSQDVKTLAGGSSFISIREAVL
jgi:hypothetical protein